MNREWDRGKDSWNSEANSWAQDAYSKDEDFYGDNKRRKFNTGVCPDKQEDQDTDD